MGEDTETAQAPRNLSLRKELSYLATQLKTACLFTPLHSPNLPPSVTLPVPQPLPLNSSSHMQMSKVPMSFFIGANVASVDYPRPSPPQDPGPHRTFRLSLLQNCSDMLPRWHIWVGLEEFLFILSTNFIFSFHFSFHKRKLCHLPE